MKKLHKINYFIVAAIIAAVVFIPISFTGGGMTVHAAASGGEYSDVLDDLRKDESFSMDYYPENRGNYSLNLIQIAESAKNELFLYVYQPSGQAGNLVASSVNISTTINDDISFYNYKLQLLNNSGTLYKYLVKDFTVKSEPTRYYCFTAIYRPFNENLGDKQVGGGNTIIEVDYPVNKQYCFSTINGKPYVQVVDIETIIVTDKFVGYARYNDGGYVWGNASCDNHFVAFNTDKPIDKLLEADVCYSTQDYSSSSWLGGGRTDYGEKKNDNYAYLKGEKVVHSGGGLFAGTYEWETIQTVDRFLEVTGQGQIYSGVIFDVSVGTPIKEEALRELKDKKWVLRFAETPYYFTAGSGSTSERRTLVGDVTILRLKFETDGVVYNIGVIDNKQTGSDDPITDNGEEHFTVTPEFGGSGCGSGFNSWLPLIIVLIAVILLIILFPSLITILGFILKALIWLIALPFKAISALVNKIKEATEERKAGEEKAAAAERSKDHPRKANAKKQQKPKTDKKQSKK